MDTGTKRDTRVPPHNLDAEESLLGAMLLSRDAIIAALDHRVDATDFYKPAHAHVYDAVLHLHHQGEGVDVVTVAAELERDELIEFVGGIAAVRWLHAATPASANARTYARIVTELATLRRLITVAGDISALAYDGGDAGAAHEQALGLLASVPVRSRPVKLLSGGTFLLDRPAGIPARWGDGDRVAWARGESMFIVGPAGVGKTTLVAQLVLAMIGLRGDVLGWTVEEAQRVLYLAADRPDQIARAFHRMVKEADREILDDRLIFQKGPPERDLARKPETLLELCRTAGANVVILDSLKDMAVGLADDDVGAGINRAIQLTLADDIDVGALHHQRKGQGGTKPKTLEDLYGSTLIAAGAGSVLLLWGAAGDPLVELTHLKQPATEIGPLTLEHDHDAGITSVYRGAVDALIMLRHAPGGLTISDVASAMFEVANPNDTQRKKAERQLKQLVEKKLATITPPKKGGDGGTQPGRYRAATNEEEPPA